MNVVEHTPTPWWVEGGSDDADRPGIDGNKAAPFSVVIYGDSDWVEDEAGVHGRTPEEAMANAAFIVRAVNAHATMKEALELAILLIEDAIKDTNWTPDSMGDEGKTVAGLRAALALAEEPR